MSDILEPYRPSNGTEGEYFMSEYCYRCQHDVPYQENPDAGGGCEILMRTMAYGIKDPEYPGDTWVYFNGRPTCLAFREYD